MVYRRSNIKVLLGPEKPERERHVNSPASDYRDGVSKDDDNFPARIRVRKSLDNRNSEQFHKMGETNVYKRTRPFKVFQGRPTLERYPSDLELSGHKVETEEDKLKAKSARNSDSARTQMTQGSMNIDQSDLSIDCKTSARSNDSEHAAEGRFSPTLAKYGRGHSSASNVLSRNVLTDFGLRATRTDTFSGHQRRRDASADLERQMEERAERHIRTCQVVGNVKRGSRAQQSYQGLKDTVSPLQSPMAFYPSLQKSAIGAYQSFAKADSNADKTNVVPYMIQIRKSVGSVSKMKAIVPDLRRSNQLPEISCRTIVAGTGGLGFGFS